MAKQTSGAKSHPVGTRSTASQTSAARGEVRDAFFRRTGKVIIPLTVKDILEEQLARKLA